MSLGIRDTLEGRFTCSHTLWPPCCDLVKKKLLYFLLLHLSYRVKAVNLKLSLWKMHDTVDSFCLLREPGELRHSEGNSKLVTDSYRFQSNQTSWSWLSLPPTLLFDTFAAIITSLQWSVLISAHSCSSQILGHFPRSFQLSLNIYFGYHFMHAHATSIP